MQSSPLDESGPPSTACIYIHINGVHTYMANKRHKNTYIHMHKCIHACTHTYIHTNSYTNIHIKQMHTYNRENSLLLNA